uniref:galectin-12-like n=1 Tax=Pristiophorus japonicus TaxID=55135 RepID=UPI00398E6464
MSAVPPSTLLQPPVFYPALPYITTVFGGLSRGRLITLHGMVPINCRRFRVDFQRGSSSRPRANIAFRFSPRFGSTPCISCSSLWAERWGPEERVPSLSLRAGHSFHITFHFQANRVLVVANGDRLLEFRYRRPLRGVDTMQIAGPVFIKVIGFLTENPYLPHQTQYPSHVPFLLKDPTLAVPLLSRIESGLAAGHMITIRGQLHQDPHEFLVVLREEDCSNVPLRLRVDFGSLVLARSSMLHQVWSQEEDESPIFSLHPGRYFEVVVLCGAECSGWR